MPDLLLFLLIVLLLALYADITLVQDSIFCELSG
jgi:hypothetical protein